MAAPATSPHVVVSSSEASSDLGPPLLQLGELRPEPSQFAVDVRQLRRCLPYLEVPLAMAHPHEVLDLAAKEAEPYLDSGAR